MAIVKGATNADPFLAKSFDVASKNFEDLLWRLFQEGVPASIFIAEKSTPWRVLRNIRYSNMAPNQRYSHIAHSVLTHPNCPPNLIEELSDTEIFEEIKALSISPNISEELEKDLLARVEFHKKRIQVSNVNLSEFILVEDLLSDYMLVSSACDLQQKIQILKSGHPYSIFSEYFQSSNYEFKEKWFGNFGKFNLLHRILWPDLRDIGARFTYWSSSYTGDCLYIDLKGFDFYRGIDQIADRGEEPLISIEPDYSNSNRFDWFKSKHNEDPYYLIENLKIHEEAFFEWIDEWDFLAGISCFMQANLDNNQESSAQIVMETNEFILTPKLVELVQNEVQSYLDSGSDFVSAVEFSEKSNNLLSWKNTNEEAQKLLINELFNLSNTVDNKKARLAQHFLECIALNPYTLPNSVILLKRLNNEYILKALELR